jgi:hypothetical protein
MASRPRLLLALLSLLASVVVFHPTAGTAAGTQALLTGRLTSHEPGTVALVHACLAPCGDADPQSHQWLEPEDDGRFELSGLPAGEIRLSMRMDVGNNLRVGYLRTRSDGTVTLVEQSRYATFFASDGSTDLGTLAVDTDGQEITGRLPGQPGETGSDEVQLWGLGAGRGATTRKDGTFTLSEVTVGTFVLKVFYWVDGFCESGFLQRTPDGAWQIVEDESEATTIEITDDVTDLGEIRVEPPHELEITGAMWTSGRNGGKVTLDLQVRRPPPGTLVDVSVGSCRSDEALIRRRIQAETTTRIPVRLRVARTGRTTWIEATSVWPDGTLSMDRYVLDNKRKRFLREC